MSLCFSLKILCDICFYLAFANILAGWAGGGKTAVFSLPFFIFSAYLGAKRQEKWIKSEGGAYYPWLTPMVFLAPGLLIAIYGSRPVDVLILLPPSLYIAYILKNKVFAILSYEHRPAFSLFYKIYILIFLWTALFGGSVAMEQFSIPFALLFGLCSAALMRSLRHDKEILEENKFQILNFSVLVLALGAGLLLSAPWFLSLCASGAKAVYTYVIAPLLLALSMVIAVPLWLLFSWLSRNNENVDFHLFQEDSVFLGFGEEITSFSGGSGSFRLNPYILPAIIFTGICLLIFWFFRRQLTYAPKNNSGREIKNVFTSGPTPHHRGKPSSSKPLKQVRRLYLDFLHLCQKKGLNFNHYATSQDIERQAAKRFENREATAAIRDIYIKNRYGGQASHKDEIKEMRERIAALKKGP